MSRHYLEDGIKHPSVTTVLGEADGGPPLQWSANMTVEWLKKNSPSKKLSKENNQYWVTDVHFDEARFHHKEYSKEAMKIGSNMHSFAEGFLNERINRTGN